MPAHNPSSRRGRAYRFSNCDPGVEGAAAPDFPRVCSYERRSTMRIEESVPYAYVRRYIGPNILRVLEGTGRGGNRRNTSPEKYVGNTNLIE
jgi:hypothetical protein